MKARRLFVSSLKADIIEELRDMCLRLRAFRSSCRFSRQELKSMAFCKRKVPAQEYPKKEDGLLDLTSKNP